MKIYFDVGDFDKAYEVYKTSINIYEEAHRIYAYGINKNIYDLIPDKENLSKPTGNFQEIK